MTGLNKGLDAGAASQFELRVIERHMGGADQRRYRTVLESWRGRGTEEIDDETLYRAVVPGSSVVAITTRPGYFGDEWIVSMTVKR